MDGLGAAIRSRRSSGPGLMGGQEEVVEEQESKGPSDIQGLKGLVDGLDDAQRSLLLKILVKEQSANENTPGLEKGAIGPGENLELEEYVSEFEPEEGHESEEEIAESMISSADKSRAEQGVSGRNLGEKVKIGLANKLKKKG